MNAYRTVTLLVALTLLLTLVGLSAAQETTEPVTCDATLVTLLLVAAQDYGYQPSIGFPVLNYAQYRSLAETITGQPMPMPMATLEPSAGQQAEAALQQAARDLEESGWGALGQGLSDISGELAAIVEAGDAALQQGQAAIQAGVDALQNRDEDHLLLTYGVVPGQHEYCDVLRLELVDFMFARLNERYGLQ